MQSSPSTSLNYLDGEHGRSRSISPVIGRSFDSMRSRTRSVSPAGRSSRLSRSAIFERSKSPYTRSNTAYDDYDQRQGEFVSICLDETDKIRQYCTLDKSHHKSKMIIEIHFVKLSIDVLQRTDSTMNRISS
jgi:hypothetical protein